MGKRLIDEGKEIFCTGVFLIRYKNRWVVKSFEDDSYFLGNIVEDVDGIPYIETPDSEYSE